jgi:uncharacterized C2H2 Zn-finger protein
MWIYTSTPPYVFMAQCLVKHKDNFTSFRIVNVKTSLSHSDNLLFLVTDLTDLLLQAVSDSQCRYAQHPADTAQFLKDACHSALENSEPEVVTGKELFLCPKCCKVYRWKKSLLLHVRYECGKEPQFRCPYCPHRAKLKGNLLRHMKRKHFVNNVTGE